MRSLVVGSAVALPLLVACGSNAPPPPTPTASSAAPAASADAPDAGAKEVDRYKAAEEKAHDDPNEKEGPIVLSPLVAKTTPKSAFPKATVADGECLKDGIPFTGNHKKDFQTIVDKCGTPTGMLKYFEPVEGRLHITKDKRDHFNFKVYKNFCYRLFAVADDGIKDIDILVLRKGALQAMDKTDHPVAVIHHDGLWCMDDDNEYDFAIEVDGAGAGKYMFGAWTRPK